MYAKFILLFFMLGFTGVVFAQQKKVDSLLNALQQDDVLRTKINKTSYDKSDTVRAKVLANLCNELRNIGSYDKALQYGEQALEVSKKINSKPLEATSNYNIGLVYYIKRNNDKALQYFETALKIRSELNDKKGITDANIMMGLLLINKGKYNEAIESFASALTIKKQINDQSGAAMAYHNIGIANFYKGDYPSALQNYLAAYKIREEIKEVRSIASSLLNIGIIYDKQGNLEDARKNYEKSLQYNIELGDKKAIAACYNNIGITYEKQRNYPEAIVFYGKALKIKEAIGDKKGCAVTHFNLATIYENHNQHDSAFVSYSTALNLSEEIGDEHGANRAMYSLGSICMRLKKYDDAKKYLDKALVTAHQLGSKENIVECYGQLIVLDSLTGNWRDAFTHYNQYFKYNDSMINADNTEQLVKAKMQYDFDKKEAITKAEQEKKELAYQKELALKVLEFEYKQKQAAAKTEKEKQQLQFEQQIKEQKINLEYNQKIAIADAKEKNQLALNKVLAQENELMLKNRKNEKLIRWLLLLGLISLITFSVTYFINYRKQKLANIQIAKQSDHLKILMQELHHRVKNNLQLISSLLELQSMRLTNDTAKQAFEEGQSRVQSIAILHQQLYQHDDISTIELSRFIDELFKQIAAAFKKPDQQLNIINALNEFYVDIEIALPLGLIINELATNSFKYAQPTNNELQLKVSLKQTEEKMYTLIYSDNGVGMPNNFSLEKAQSLGLRIVSKLAKQVKGASTYQYNNGSIFSVSFAVK